MTGKPAIASKIPSKSPCWTGSSRSSAARRAALVVGQDHLPHDRQPVGGHEHVLGAAEPDALGAELARLRGVLGRVGVRAHAQAADLVGPAEDRLEVLVDRGGTSGTLPTITRPVPPSIVSRSPSASSDVADPHRAGADVDRERLAAGDARLAHAARDDRGVRGHAAVRGEDASCVDQPVDVVGRRLPADEHDVLARPAALLGDVGVEHDRAGRGARRGVQPGRDDLDLGAGVDHRVEQLVELARRRSARPPPRARSAPPSTISTAIRSAACAVRLPVRVWSR